MSAINTYKELTDTIESLERRVQKHDEILKKIEKLVKNCTGKRISQEVAQALQETIKQAYK
jgi:histone H3/H4